MRHVYSIVRFVPNPASGECINLGLLAGSEDSAEWMLQTVDTKAHRRRVQQLGGIDAFPTVIGYLEKLATDLDVYTDAHAGGQQDLMIDSGSFNEQWLANFSDRQRGIVQFTPPLPIEADNTDGAVQFLWEHLIEEPSRRVAGGFKTKHAALGAVNQAFRRAGITESSVLRTAHLESQGFRASIDFAVRNGSVAYLTQCWSFQLPDQEKLLEDVQSWAWAIRSLRSSGGMLGRRDKASIEVSKDVELSVVYVPPKQQDDDEAFQKSKRAFEDPDVNVSSIVSEQKRDAVDQVAQRAFTALNRI